MLVGLVTGAVVTLGSVLLQKLKIDDAVNAIPIHAFGGVCGAVLCALFASPQYLPLHSRLRQTGVQLLGAGVNFLWSFGMGLLMFWIIKKTVGLRVQDEEEEKGLNIVEFSDVYSWLQYLKEEHYESLTQDLSEKVRSQNVILKRQANMLVETQEKERETIARNLHDGVGQSLVALKIHLGLLRQSTKDEQLRQQTDQTIALAQDTIDGIREVIYDLRPVKLTKDGLSNSVRSLCEKLQELSELTIRCTVSPDLPRWSETEEVNLYRIVQECLTNIIKHAEATEVELEMLKISPKTVLIRISDNGRGFDVNRVSSGFGLTTIHDRAAMLNARLMMDSEIGGGTRIVLEVPYGEH
jgi:Amt family ammonium transporter